MKYLVCGLLVLLVVLQQSGWAADRSELLFGFLPAGLVFHGAISLAAGLVWLLATMYAWPVDDESTSPTASTGARALPAAGDEQ